VRSEGPARFDGRPVELHLPQLQGVESARLVVRDGLGQIVDSADVPKAGGAHLWRGFGADGLPLAAGSYSFQMVGYAEGQPIDSAPVESFGRVVEARRDPDGTRLVLEGGREIALDAVTAMRGASAQ
jgi:flagellar basal-body rod modification protein FlgD